MPDGYCITPRLEFFDYDPLSPVLADLRNRVPTGFELRPIDLSLLNRRKWRDDIAFYCASLENFLRNGLGICRICGDEIIVETYARLERFTISLIAVEAMLLSWWHTPSRHWSNGGITPIRAAMSIILPRGVWRGSWVFGQKENMRSLNTRRFCRLG